MPNILVDTPIWVDFLRAGNPELENLLNENRVLMHPMIIGELACGNLSNRRSLLKLWNSLGHLSQASHMEVLYFIENNRLMGQGIGYIDAHLLASVTLSTHAGIWTLDKRLANIASKQSLNWNGK